LAYLAFFAYRQYALKGLLPLPLGNTLLGLVGNQNQKPRDVTIHYKDGIALFVGQIY